MLRINLEAEFHDNTFIEGTYEVVPMFMSIEDYIPINILMFFNLLSSSFLILKEHNQSLISRTILKVRARINVYKSWKRICYNP